MINFLQIAKINKGRTTCDDICDDANLKTRIERWPDLPDIVMACILAIIDKEVASI